MENQYRLMIEERWQLFKVSLLAICGMSSVNITCLLKKALILAVKVENMLENVLILLFT